MVRLLQPRTALGRVAGLADELHDTGRQATLPTGRTDSRWLELRTHGGKTKLGRGALAPPTWNGKPYSVRFECDPLRGRSA